MINIEELQELKAETEEKHLQESEQRQLEEQRKREEYHCSISKHLGHIYTEEWEKDIEDTIKKCITEGKEIKIPIKFYFSSADQGWGFYYINEKEYSIDDKYVNDLSSLYGKPYLSCKMINYYENAVIERICDIGIDRKLISVKGALESQADIFMVDKTYKRYIGIEVN